MTVEAGVVSPANVLIGGVAGHWLALESVQLPWKWSSGTAESRRSQLRAVNITSQASPSPTPGELLQWKTPRNA